MIGSLLPYPVRIRSLPFLIHPLRVWFVRRERSVSRANGKGTRRGMEVNRERIDRPGRVNMIPVSRASLGHLLAPCRGSFLSTSTPLRGWPKGARKERESGNIIIKTTYDISLDFQDSLLPLGFLSLSRLRSSFPHPSLRSFFRYALSFPTWGEWRTTDRTEGTKVGWTKRAVGTVKKEIR